MLRTDLLDKLVMVSPALSGNSLVPLLSHFWFLGDKLLAYNDQIGIQTDFDSGFTGAVPDTLVSLLSVSKAKEVSFLTRDKVFTVKAASSNFKLPILDIDLSKPIFAMPKPDHEGLVHVDMNDFLDALESCMRSLKEDTSIPDSLGITLEFKDESIRMFATNDATISSASVKLKKPVKKPRRVVISGNFCRQMVSIEKAVNHTPTLEIHNDYSLFRCRDTILFGRLVDVQRPLDFAGAIENSFPAKAIKSLVPIPSKLELILDRASIITDTKQERPKTEIKIGDGVAHFYSQSERGEVKDQMQVENHPAVSISIDPNLFKAGYGFFDKFLITERCLVMSKGSSLYLVSASH